MTPASCLTIFETFQHFLLEYRLEPKHTHQISQKSSSPMPHCIATRTFWSPHTGSRKALAVCCVLLLLLVTGAAGVEIIERNDNPQHHETNDSHISPIIVTEPLPLKVRCWSPFALLSDPTILLYIAANNDNCHALVRLLSSSTTGNDNIL